MLHQRMYTVVSKNRTIGHRQKGISQGRAVTPLKCGGICSLYYKFTCEFGGERIEKIGQYLANLSARTIVALSKNS